jgi:hypothetical protein
MSVGEDEIEEKMERMKVAYKNENTGRVEVGK